MSLHTIETFVEAEDIAKIKNRTLILPLEILRRRSKLASQKNSPEAYDPNLANMCTKKRNDPNNKNKTHFGMSCNYCCESNYSIPIGFRNNKKTKELKMLFFSIELT